MKLVNQNILLLDDITKEDELCSSSFYFSIFCIIYIIKHNIMYIIKILLYVI